MKKIDFFKKYRWVDFINREEEINYFLEYFAQQPEKVLLVYWPKSAGKTTLIEYVIENYLLKEKDLNVKYINLRSILIWTYDTFLESILEEKDNDEEEQTELNRIYNLWIFKLEAKTLKKIKEDKKNLFHYLMKEFAKNKRNIFIIDEIQKLKNILINWDRKLLDEFLNFCVRLTKEKHISHVVILTSDTLFLDEIYNNSKLQETSKFKLIWHLKYEDVKKWLETKWFNEEEINLIYEYLWWSATRIKKLLEDYKRFNSLKEYLQKEAKIAANFVKLFIEQNKLTKEEREKFFYIAKTLIKNWEFDNSKHEWYLDIISKFAEAEILFYDPLEDKVTPNSPIYVKAFELLLERKT